MSGRCQSRPSTLLLLRRRPFRTFRTFLRHPLPSYWEEEEKERKQRERKRGWQARSRRNRLGRPSFLVGFWLLLLRSRFGDWEFSFEVDIWSVGARSEPTKVAHFEVEFLGQWVGKGEVTLTIALPLSFSRLIL